MVKSSPAKQEMWVPSLGQEDPLEKEMETQSSILASEIPRTEESGGHSPWGRRELDTTKHAHVYTSLKLCLFQLCLFEMSVS